jgi:GDP-4-dehydro-6-deoxy-D-mannose reductase
VPALARRVLHARTAGERSIAMGAREPVRDLSDVRDVVAAYRLLVERGTPGEVYNVCSGAGVPMGEIADRLIALTGAPLEVTVDPAFVRPTEVPRLVGDPTKLATETGWQARFSLDDTLRAVLDDARAQHS